ncbi:hypothetical protein SAMN02745194_00339 [Roseomonas rosea]|uniref:Uncharacterized protein n=2 Tax=Muricoccus roseus TaxID=198092 RepID=A0A1M6B2L2_9PROT|nr:hypothetical protein SAMN02745194_00339 [Roseomonas rosea]
MTEEKPMIQLDLPREEAQLEEVIGTLAVLARSTGRNAAGGVLEALRDTLATQPHQPVQRR